MCVCVCRVWFASCGLHRVCVCVCVCARVFVCHSACRVSRRPCVCGRSASADTNEMWRTTGCAAGSGRGLRGGGGGGGGGEGAAVWWWWPSAGRVVVVVAAAVAAVTVSFGFMKNGGFSTTSWPMLRMRSACSTATWTMSFAESAVQPMLRVALGEHALPHLRRHGEDAELVDELGHHVLHALAVGAGGDAEQRPLRRLEQRDRVVDRLLVGHRAADRVRREEVRAVGDGERGDVFGELEVDGPGLLLDRDAHAVAHEVRHLRWWAAVAGRRWWAAVAGGGSTAPP